MVTGDFFNIPVRQRSFPKITKKLKFVRCKHFPDESFSYVCIHFFKPVIPAALCFFLKCICCCRLNFYLFWQKELLCLYSCSLFFSPPPDRKNSARAPSGQSSAANHIVCLTMQRQFVTMCLVIKNEGAIDFSNAQSPCLYHSSLQHLPAQRFLITSMGPLR